MSPGRRLRLRRLLAHDLGTQPNETRATRRLSWLAPRTDFAASNADGFADAANDLIASDDNGVAGLIQLQM
jgi:hypothetical protein